jgi:hypothetical protein
MDLKNALLILLILFLQINISAQQILPTNKKRSDSLLHVPIRLVPSDYYSKGLGFMCKKELQVEKASKIPFRLRLGSIEYVDKLEGKGNWKN